MKQIATLLLVGLFSVVLPGTCKPVAYLDGYFAADSYNSYNKKVVKAYKKYDKQFLKDFNPEDYSSRAAVKDVYLNGRQAYFEETIFPKRDKLKERDEKLESKYYGASSSYNAMIEAYRKFYKEDLMTDINNLHEHVSPQIEKAVSQIPCKYPDEDEALIREVMADRYFSEDIDNCWVDFNGSQYTITDLKTEATPNSDAGYRVDAIMRLKHNTSKDRVIDAKIVLYFKPGNTVWECWRFTSCRAEEMHFVPSETYRNYVSLTNTSDGYIVQNDSDERLMVMLKVYSEYSVYHRAVYLDPNSQHQEHEWIKYNYEIEYVVTA